MQIKELKKLLSLTCHPKSEQVSELVSESGRKELKMML